MNRAERRAMGCRGGRHVPKNLPDGEGRIVTICAACERVLSSDGGDR